MFRRFINSHIFVSPFYIIFLVCLLCSTNTVQSQGKRAYKAKEDTIISFKDRWSVKTNAVGWLMTIPNAAVEFDISNSVYNKLTLNLEGKYNGYTSHNYLPYMVMEVVMTLSSRKTVYRGNTLGQVSLPDIAFRYILIRKVILIWNLVEAWD